MFRQTHSPRCSRHQADEVCLQVGVKLGERFRRRDDGSAIKVGEVKPAGEWDGE
jgi:hypothetical protein